MTRQWWQLCRELGWRGPRGRWDVLPLLLSANGEDPQIFELPEDLVLRVQLTHPRYSWFEELGLQWYALPAVSGMLFDVGGLEFTAAPFNGWYMETEIGSRDLGDTGRYNVAPEVAGRLGLDTTSPASLWMDRAVLELNVAVLHSFQLNPRLKVSKITTPRFELNF
ncbi:NOS1 [Cordylochernes scorpioides]|uniref:nitric-oxide synthase (NADPH) n=1 Tax=Cordylochernes scorpioides TaxID=51811 RepID=A0ABY6K5U5_9ARAC|nr:NOS1 [Cordylochernes scorpioides]